MGFFSYASSDVDIRDDISSAHNHAWQKIAQAGTWYTGKQRIAIAAEVRHAKNCGLCAQRKQALSPNMVDGEHEQCTDLDVMAVDAIHRLVTDASRLSAQWLEKTLSTQFTDAHYVELLGVLVAVISIDGFHRAMGLPLEPLPQAQAGDPTKIRPASAKNNGSWVATINPADACDDEADLYGGQKQTGNVIAAMSLVPESVRLLKSLASVHYLKDLEVMNPAANGGRAISRSQMELLAGRVSSINDCFY